ncbi:hypothetical protein DOY81_010539 [Sarcophaga bullata]|nr:hypothetical protein DOY81_010539 [Sarcophaga bullata]
MTLNTKQHQSIQLTIKHHHHLSISVNQNRYCSHKPKEQCHCVKTKNIF